MSTSLNKELAAERMEKIARIIRVKRIVRVNELSRELGVSPATIRRDLVDMEGRGQAVRVHGGAVCVDRQLDEPVFDDKASIAAAEKQAIAQAAMSFVKPGDSIFLDGGSTVLALARLVADMRKLTVVTNSLRVAGIFATSGPRTILVGGDLRRLSQTFVGPLTRPLIERLHVDTAFMGTMGLAVKQGLTTTDPREAQTKSLVMDNAGKCILLADSSKLGKVSFVSFAALSELDMFITDDGASTSSLKEFKKAEIEAVVAKTDG